MKAVLLVGGEGTRLRPLTWQKPKSACPVLNQPLLTHLILTLQRHGVTDIILAATANYSQVALEQLLGDGSALGVRLRYSVETEPLGSAGAVKLLEKELQ